MLLKAHRSAPVKLPAQANHSAPAKPPARPGPAGRAPAQPVSTFRYHGLPPRSLLPLLLAGLVSLALHAGLVLGFNEHKVPKRIAVVEEAPAELLIMPDLSEPEEKKYTELNDDEPVEMAVQVPMLQDVPLNVPLDSSFTQLIDPTIPTKLEGAASQVLAIPVNIQRGRPDTSKISDLFNVADLDRRPEPISQTPPTFPYELRQAVPYGTVRVGFIVTSRGDVIMPYIVNSSDRGFERAAMDAVSKWKFRPGMKNGRKVNTRVEQPIEFKVVDE